MSDVLQRTLTAQTGVKTITNRLLALVSVLWSNQGESGLFLPQASEMKLQPLQLNGSVRKVPVILIASISVTFSVVNINKC